MIQFKAKRIDNGETVIGYYNNSDGTNRDMEKTHWIITDGYQHNPIDPSTLKAVIDGKEIDINSLGDVMEFMKYLNHHDHCRIKDTNYPICTCGLYSLLEDYV